MKCYLESLNDKQDNIYRIPSKKVAITITFIVVSSMSTQSLAPLILSLTLST